MPIGEAKRHAQMEVMRIVSLRRVSVFLTRLLGGGQKFKQKPQIPGGGRYELQQKASAGIALGMRQHAKLRIVV